MFFWSRLRNKRIQSRFPRLTVAKRSEHEAVPGLIKIGRADIPCAMQALTTTSVILEFAAEAPSTLPPFFYLKPQSERLFRRGRLLWRHRKQAGVEFITDWSKTT